MQIGGIPLIMASYFYFDLEVSLKSHHIYCIDLPRTTWICPLNPVLQEYGNRGIEQSNAMSIALDPPWRGVKRRFYWVSEKQHQLLQKNEH